MEEGPALLIGGGSPVATYWAVAEYGHHFGIRPMLFGDLDPVSPPEFKLDGVDFVLEPQIREREWHFRNRGPMDSGSWSVEEHRRVLQQLAKLKFNRVSINVRASQPFVHFEFQGVRRRSEGLWGYSNFVYPVSGDTAGRKVFGGAKNFENPSFAAATTYEERIAAGKRHLTGIIDAAQAAGMTVRLQLQPDWLPSDFASVVEVAFINRTDGPWVIAAELFEDDKTRELARTQMRAYLDAYPNIDGIDLDFRAPKVSQRDFHHLFSEQNFFRRPDGRQIAVRIRASQFPGRAFVPLEQIDQPDLKIAPQMILLSERERFLPYSALDFPEAFVQARQRNGDCVVVDPEAISDLDIPLYWLSRSSFGTSLTFEQSYRQLVDLTCGEEVADRVFWALQHNHFARRKLQKMPFGGGKTGPLNLSRLETFDSKDREQLASAAEAYLMAMNEMYRANTRAREGGRAFTLYWARRFEFAFEYLNFAQAVGKASASKTANDSATQIAELEKAIESLNNALNAMAAVARSNSDRGLIAVLNMSGYRPLKKKLAEAEAAAK